MAGNFDSIEETKSEENDFSLQLIILFGFLFMFFYPIIPAFNEFKKEKMMVRMSSFGIFIEIMHLMTVVYITLLEGFQVHFQALAEEMALGVASRWRLWWGWCKRRLVSIKKK